MKKYQVRFPVITVAEDTPVDAVARAIETLTQLAHTDDTGAFVNQVVALEGKTRPDWDLIHAAMDAAHEKG